MTGLSISRSRYLNYCNISNGPAVLNQTESMESWIGNLGRYQVGTDRDQPLFAKAYLTLVVKDVVTSTFT